MFSEHRETHFFVGSFQNKQKLSADHYERKVRKNWKSAKKHRIKQNFAIVQDQSVYDSKNPHEPAHVFLQN